MKRTLLLLMFGLGLYFSQAQTQITIDETPTVQELIEDILIVGDCADVSNIVSPVNSQVTNQGFNSYAAFDGTTASPDFPFTDGIVLATNGVQSITDFTIPVQNGDDPDFGGTWVGDADLEALINEPGNTNNATVIEFDFIPYQDQIEFNYLLASNEWPSFVCNFADTFAFTISGTGISDVNPYDHDANPNTPDLNLDLGGLNIATLPGTNIPVNPTNIHDLTATCFPGDLGEFAVPQLYDVDGEDDGTTLYFGRTVPLTATAQVVPGETYTIKLAIADRSDNILNSAVFIEGQSFQLFDPDLGEDLTISGQTAACVGDTITLDTGLDPSLTGLNILWLQDGAQIPEAVDQPSIVVTEPGVYQAGVQTLSGGCITISEPITIEFYPPLDFGTQDSFTLCQGESLTINGEPANVDVYETVDYLWRLNGSLIQGATSPDLTVDQGGVYELTVTPNNCPPEINTYTVNLIDYEVNIADPEVDCIDPGTVITLSANFNESLTQEQIDNEVTYEWTTNEGNFNTPTVDITEGQTVSLTTTFEGCPESDTQTFTFFNNPVVEISGPNVLCQDDTATLDGTPSNLEELTGAEYTWLLNGIAIEGQTEPTLDINTGGTYEVIVDNNSCAVTSAAFEVELIDYSVSLPSVPDPCVSSESTITVVPEFEGLTQDEIDNGVTYLWTVGEDTFTTPSIELTEGQEVTLTTTFSNCEETATETFVFFNTPVVDIAGMDVLCAGETNTLNATPLNLNDLDQENLTYVWTLNENVIADANGPVLEITEGGTYLVAVTQNEICVGEDTFEVEFVDFIGVSLGEDIIECSGGDGSVVLEPFIEGNLTPEQENQIFYLWSDGSDGQTLTVTESGTYSVEVSIGESCFQSDEILVTFTQTVQATVEDAVKCPTDGVTLQATLLSDVAGVTYQWFLEGNALEGQTNPTIEVGPTQLGEYSVVVNNQGCLSNPAVATVTNYEVAQCVISQGISPNEDSFNDCLDLTWLNDESDIKKLSVFNRYGQLVFEEDNYVDTFCGQTDTGDRLSTGTYFYVIELERESTKLDQGLVVKGWVYINTEQ